MEKSNNQKYVTEVIEEVTTYVFEDNHRYIDHYDQAEIICPEASDIYFVRSNLGNKYYYCPGCGSQLDPRLKKVKDK